MQGVSSPACFRVSSAQERWEFSSWVWTVLERLQSSTGCKLEKLSPPSPVRHCNTEQNSWQLWAVHQLVREHSRVTQTLLSKRSYWVQRWNCDLQEPEVPSVGPWWTDEHQVRSTLSLCSVYIIAVLVSSLSGILTGLILGMSWFSYEYLSRGWC